MVAMSIDNGTGFTGGNSVYKSNQFGFNGASMASKGGVLDRKLEARKFRDMEYGLAANSGQYRSSFITEDGDEQKIRTS